MSAHITWVPLDAVRGTMLGICEFDPATFTQKDANNNDVLVGVAAPLGSLLINAATGTLYQKTGSAATAWTTLGGGAFVVKTGDTMTGALMLPNMFIGGDTNVNAELDNDVANRLHLTFAGGASVGVLLVDGKMQQSGVDVAKVIISTSAPSGTPASGVGTFWAQVT